MRLSEAMRLGAMMKPQGFGAFFDGGKSCALGAVCDAVGITKDNEHAADPFRQVWTVFPFSNERVGSVCPVPGCNLIMEGHVVTDVIYHLNDGHRWTRERIADYVETLEPPPVPDVAPLAHQRVSAK